MNKNYRSIWNEALGAWVAVSEIENAKGKPAKSGFAGALSAVGTVAGRGARFAFTAVMSALLLASGQVAAAQINGGAATGTTNTCYYDTASATVICGDATTVSDQTEGTKTAKAVVLGTGAKNDGESSIVIGNGAKVATWDQTVANAAQALGTNSPVAAIAIGNSTNAQNDGVIALGSGANAVSLRDIAIGSDAGKNSTNMNSVGNNIMVGQNAGSSTKTTNLIALGVGAAAGLGSNLSVSTGYGAFRNIAIGTNANSADVNKAAAVAGAKNAASASDVLNGGSGAFNANYTLAIGDSSLANKNHSTAIGSNARSMGTYSLAMGSESMVDNAESVAIGYSAKTGSGVNANKKGLNVAIGTNATNADSWVRTSDKGRYTTWESTAVGADTLTQGVRTTAVGYGAQATEYYATALGYKSNATEWHALAMGSEANAAAEAIDDKAESDAILTSDTSNGLIGNVKTASNSAAAIAIGRQATAAGYAAIAEGLNARATAALSTAIGANSVANSMTSLAIGSRAEAKENGAIAIGSTIKQANATKATGKNSVALGNYIEVTKPDNSVATQTNLASGENAVSIGAGAQATAKNTISIGTGNIVSGEGSGAFGDPSIVAGTNSYSVGNNNAIGKQSDNVLALGGQNSVGATAERNSSGVIQTAFNLTDTQDADRSFVLGYKNTVASTAQSNDSVVLGNNNIVNASNVMVLGNNIADVTIDNNVILGNNSSQKSATTAAGLATDVGSATVGGITYGGFAGTPAGIASVGATGQERQIINVAAGKISADSTDAVNGSQLYAANVAVSNMAASVASALGGSVAVGADGRLSAPDYNLNGTSYNNVGDVLTALANNDVKYYSVNATDTAAGSNADNKGATGTDALAMGVYASAGGSGSVAAGKSATSSGTGSVALGQSSSGVGASAVAVGNSSTASHENAVAIGNSARAAGSGNISIGENSGKVHPTTAQGANAVFIGVQAGAESANNQAQISLGWEAGKGTLGAFNMASGYQAGQFVNGTNNVAIGKQAGKGTEATSRLAVSDTVAIGTTAKAAKNNAVAIGSESQVNVEKGVALGAGSIANVAAGQVGIDPLNAVADKTGSTWTATTAAVSVGAADGSKTRQITGLAAGTNDVDAVNVAQLKAAGFKLAATNTGGGEVTALSEADKIQNGETVTVDAGENIKITQTNGKLEIATKDDLDVTSVIAGNSKLISDGLTITNPADQNKNVTLTTAGLNNGGNKITNVAAGDQPNDAVNVKQLDDAIANVGTTTKTEITTNSPFAYVNGAGEILIRNVEPDGTVKFTKAKGGDPYAGTDITIAALNPTAVAQSTIPTRLENIANGVENDEAVNVSQLKALTATLGGGAEVNPDGSIKNPNYSVKGVTYSNVGGAVAALDEAVQKPLTFSGDNVAQDFKRTLDSKVNVKGGATGTLTENNIGVVSDGTDTLTVKLAEDISLGDTGSVTVGDTVVDNTGVTVGAATKLTSDGLTAGGVSVKADGINAGKQQITNLAEGVQDTDAVNVSQLNAVKTSAAVKTQLNAGSGTTVTNNGSADAPNYEVAVKQTGLTVDPASGKVAAGTAGDSFATAADVAAAINDSEKTTTAQKGSDAVKVEGTPTGNNTDYVIDLSDASKASLSKADTALQTVTSGDANLTVGAKDAAGNITLDFSDNPAFASVTTGNTVVADGKISGLNDYFAAVPADAKSAAKPAAPASAGQAATVNDVLNAAWNLQANGNAVDAVTPFDTVNFKDGKGTKISAESKDGVSTVTVDVDAQKLAEAAQLPVVYTKADGTKVYKVNGKFTTDPTGQDAAQEVADADVIASMQNADGTTATPTKLTNVAPAAVTADSKDAVNGSQLYAAAANTAKYLGGNATVDADGNVTAPAYTLVSGMPSENRTAAYNTVGDALGALNTAVTAPLTFAGDNDAVKVERKLGSELAVKGGATGALSDNNIGVSGDTAANSLNVKLAKELQGLTSASFNDAAGNSTQVGGNGVTVTPANGKAPVTLTSDGLNNGGNKITNVAEGQADTDAVNVAQLKAVAASAGGKTVAGKNIQVTPEKAADGSTTYTVATADDVDFNSVTAGKGSNQIVLDDKGVNVGGNTYVSSAGLNANGKKVANVAAGTEATDAVNVAQLNDTVGKAAAAATSKVAEGKGIAVTPEKAADGSTTYTVAAKTDGNTVTVDGQGNIAAVTGSITNTGGKAATTAPDALATAGSVAEAINNSGFTLTAQDANGSMVNPGATVDMNNTDGNISVSKAAGSNAVTYNLAKDIKVDSVTAGDTVVNNSGLTIANGPSVTNNGIDAGNKVIANVSDGRVAADSKEAVNGSQLHQVYQVLGSGTSAIDSKPATEIAGDTAAGTANTAPTNTINVNAAGNIVTTITQPDGTVTTKEEAAPKVAVSTDKAGQTYTMTTYNVKGQDTYVTNDVIQAIGKMNEQGIKFFHTNDGEVVSVAQGHNTVDSSASGAYASAVGYQAVAAGTNAVALGKGAQANAENTISIGTGNIVNGKNSGAIGDPSIIDGQSSYSVGNNNTVRTDSTYAFGSNITQTVDNSVFLGDNAGSDGVHTTADGGNYTYQGANDANVAGVSDAVGVVSVGKAGETRQVQNVAAGVVSATSTDAINGSQLYHT
ncbi:ESPR-type extended signal peptide-containing protein, partial [Neisseria sp.]|uniref:ESPR-type extended signal peptide-containing protein n=1 Tax=Neisseria sp. TaxID=192066 RepID=UPI0035A15862